MTNDDYEADTGPGSEIQPADPLGEGLGQYGQVFQEKVLQALLTDHTWARQMTDVFDPRYFDRRYLEYLSERYFAYAKKYRTFPTLHLLVTIIRDELRTGVEAELKDVIVSYLRRMHANPDQSDLPYVKDRALDFCKRQALKEALSQSIDMIDGNRYESIIEVVKRAVTVGSPVPQGHDFVEDREARFHELSRRCVPTGIPELDAPGVLSGGAAGGELSCVIGASGSGKSHFLVALGAAAMQAGVSVLHITLELSEHQVARRYDSHLCGVDSDQVIVRKSEVIAYYDANPKLGRLKVVYYPTGSASVNTIRALVEQYSLRGFTPGLILVDYADIMRSSRKHESLRHELKEVYEELRGLSGELNVPVWTASQSNKEGARAEVIDMTNMSEGFSKAFVADFLVTISRRQNEKASGHGRLFVAKNRAGKDGQLFAVQIDTAQSRFQVTSTLDAEVDAAQDAMNMRSAAGSAWEKFKQSRELDMGPSINSSSTQKH